MTSETTQPAPEGAADTKLDRILDAVNGLAARVDALEARRAERTDSEAKPPIARNAKEIEEEERLERAGLADAQARADQAAIAFAERAPPPMTGERLRAYRERLLKGFQGRSADFKNVDLHGLDDAAFAAVEKRIYADAVAVGLTAADVPPRRLRELRQRDPMTGREMIAFVGDPEAWMGHFKLPVRLASFGRPGGSGT